MFELDFILNKIKFVNADNIKTYTDAFKLKTKDDGVSYNFKRIIGKKEYIDNNTFEVILYPFQEDIITNISNNSKNCKMFLVLDNTQVCEITDDLVIMPFLTRQHIKIRIVFNTKEDVPLFFTLNYSAKILPDTTKFMLSCNDINTKKFIYKIGMMIPILN